MDLESTFRTCYQNKRFLSDVKSQCPQGSLLDPANLF
jgi:hypothetical protein